MLRKKELDHDHAYLISQMGDSTTKPAFGSGPFYQSGFGSQSSGGFSGGSFSAQGSSVVASGFGFGASSPSGKGCRQYSISNQHALVNFIG